LRVLVLALGNPILGDDGVALHVVKGLRGRLTEGRDLVLDESATGGIDLLEHVMGFDRVLVLDALMTGRGPPGEVRTLPEGDLGGTLNTSCTHTASFETAMEMGRRLHPGAMPAEIVVVGVEVGCVAEFSETLTPAVEAAVPAAVDAAVRVLGGWGVQVG
jgi:hydrogenase maturation protease